MDGYSNIEPNSDYFHTYMDSPHAEETYAEETYAEESYEEESYYEELTAVYKAKNRLDVLSLVCGIVSFFLIQWAIPLGLMAILIATIGKPKGYSMTGKAKAGMICGIIAMSLSIFIILISIILYFSSICMMFIGLLK